MFFILTVLKFVSLAASVIFFFLSTPAPKCKEERYARYGFIFSAILALGSSIGATYKEHSDDSQRIENQEKLFNRIDRSFYPLKGMTISYECEITDGAQPFRAYRDKLGRKAEEVAKKISAIRMSENQKLRNGKTIVPWNGKIDGFTDSNVYFTSDPDHKVIVEELEVGTESKFFPRGYKKEGSLGSLINYPDEFRFYMSALPAEEVPSFCCDFSGGDDYPPNYIPIKDFKHKAWKPNESFSKEACLYFHPTIDPHKKHFFYALNGLMCVRGKTKSKEDDMRRLNGKILTLQDLYGATVYFGTTWSIYEWWLVKKYVQLSFNLKSGISVNVDCTKITTIRTKDNCTTYCYTFPKDRTEFEKWITPRNDYY